MRGLVLLILGLLLTACSSTLPHVAAADKITNPYISETTSKFGISVMGTGGKMMGGKVEDVSISFLGYGEFDLEQARRHYLNVVKPFVEGVANSVELKQYLKNPNAPENAALISITYLSNNGEHPRPPHISHVFMLKGRIIYSVSDARLEPYRTIHEETYQEALDKLGIR